MPNVLLDLLLPTGCAGCGEAAAVLCPACSAAFGEPRPHRPKPCPPQLPPMAVCADYDGPARAVLLAYKERGRRDVASQLGFALAGAVAALVHNRGGPPAAALVPVPSTRAAARARGGDHVLRLAEVARRLLADAGLPTRVSRWLRVARRVQDSAGLSATGRVANLAGAFAVRRPARLTLPGGSLVCLVDDVITTGATVAEARRALHSAGVDVGAIAAIAGTRRRHYSLHRQ